MLADVFEQFRNMRHRINELDYAHFLSATGLKWQADLKKTIIKLDLLTDIDLLSMLKKGIRGIIYHAIQRHMKANIKYMKNYGKNKKSSYLKYWDVNNSYRWVMPQNLHANDFKRI